MRKKTRHALHNILKLFSFYCIYFLLYVILFKKEITNIYQFHIVRLKNTIKKYMAQKLKIYTLVNFIFVHFQCFRFFQIVFSRQIICLCLISQRHQYLFVICEFNYFV